MVIKVNKKIEVIKIEETLILPENLRNQIDIVWENRERYGITKLLEDFNKYGIKILQK